ncbi:FAD-binding oxidoreductase [Gymnodinialimonas sp. 2305UL16-5]|uniref:NAD(P)/FAD-dependent oxidoreductase n=1 Tax=Gymnodinialimonas mytili TaxID=3126503 RepID=UPI0030AFD739
MNAPYRLSDPPEHGSDLPEAVDLAVIGGGVIGVTTALFAARAGLRVAVLEKGRVAGEQSSRNWGWVRVQGRDVSEIPVAQDAQEIWKALDAEAKGRLGLRQTGVTYLARTDADAKRHSDWLSTAQPFGVSSRMLSRAETHTLMGNARVDWQSALHTPTDMVAEPWQAVPELARMAMQAGATIIERCAVRGLDVSAGRVTGVVTERGRLRAEQVVLAGGAWSSLLLRRHGIDIPQLSVRSTALATNPLPQMLASAAVDDRLALRPRRDGGYTLAPGSYSELFLGPDMLRHIRRYIPTAMSGEFEVHLRLPAPRGYPDAFSTPRNWEFDGPSPFEAMRILNPAPSLAKASELKRLLAQAYPQFGHVTTQAAWAGMIDVLPDVVPIVDRADALPGLIVATGMCGHGFGIGPAYGRILSDLIQEKEVRHDLACFSLLRFSGRDTPKRDPT